jgi:hypothetical protein
MTHCAASNTRIKMPSARNHLHTAIENLDVSLMSLSDTVPHKVTTLKRFLIGLLHNNESLSVNDPNHPYTRFGSSDAESNCNRLHAALDELCVDEYSDIVPLVNMMFEVPDTDQYEKTRNLMTRYRAYARSNGADDSSDSDDSD